MSDRADWEREVCPNDLGDGNHRWSWLRNTDGKRNILWMHTCKNGKRTLCWIDITSGERHRLISEEPLHIEASVLCPVEGCGDHGFVRGGLWVPA